MAAESLRPKPTAPLHGLFRFAALALKESPIGYGKRFNETLFYTRRYFDELRNRVKEEKKSVRRFDETLNLLQMSQPHEDFDKNSKRYYGDINLQVRHILYLLTWGYFYDTPVRKDMGIRRIVDNYNLQLSSLAENLGGKPTEKINLAELANAVMEGNFDPSSLSKASPFFLGQK